MKSTAPIRLILKPSSIDGIGVFALTPIRKGEPVPLSHEGDSRIIPSDELDRLPQDFSKFHVPDPDGNWWGPVDYHRMSFGWFLNHSKTPNIDVSANFTTMRAIRIGEELTIDYSFWKFSWVRERAKRFIPPWYDLLD
jgi:SET domain-containing protein